MTPTLTRRRFLGSAAGAACLAGGADARRADAAQVLRQFVVPAVDRLEGNYAGQFLFVGETADADAGDVPIDSCEFDAWPRDETQVYQGQLLDSHQEAPVAVELEVYADGSKAEVESGTHFIIQSASSCGEGYVGLEVEWIQRRAVVGEPRGPTVTETGTGGQPGFGLLAAAGGIGIGVLARALTRSRRGDRSEE